MSASIYHPSPGITWMDQPPRGRGKTRRGRTRGYWVRLFWETIDVWVPVWFHVPYGSPLICGLRQIDRRSRPRVQRWFSTTRYGGRRAAWKAAESWRLWHVRRGSDR